MRKVTWAPIKSSKRWTFVRLVSFEDSYGWLFCRIPLEGRATLVTRPTNPFSPTFLFPCAIRTCGLKAFALPQEVFHIGITVLLKRFRKSISASRHKIYMCSAQLFLSLANALECAFILSGWPEPCADSERFRSEILHNDDFCLLSVARFLLNEPLTNSYSWIGGEGCLDFSDKVFSQTLHVVGLFFNIRKNLVQLTLFFQPYRTAIQFFARPTAVFAFNVNPFITPSIRRLSRFRGFYSTSINCRLPHFIIK